jgi:hypothetical protein
MRKWFAARDTRDWLLGLALLMAFASCRSAASAREMAEQAVDQSDAAEGEARRAKETAEQAQAEIENLRYDMNRR